jgi:hypothetical protein
LLLSQSITGLLRSWGLIDGSGHRAAHGEAVPASGSSRFAAPRWFFMSKLKGREVLIVEDEALIAMELVQAFRKVGAFTTTTNTQAGPLVTKPATADVVVATAEGLLP